MSFINLSQEIHKRNGKPVHKPWWISEKLDVNTHSLRVFSTSCFEGRLRPSNTKIGLTLKVRSISTNFMQYHTYLGLERKSAVIRGTNSIVPLRRGAFTDVFPQERAIVTGQLVLL